jgi:DNA recombination protein RmuC
MFIPSEGVYYDLLVNQVGAVKVNTRDLIEYAFKEKRVIIVSPTSFAAYLQTVLQGLKALAVEESIKEIVDNISKLGSHLNSYQSYFQKLGSNLGTTVNMYNSASKEFGKIDKDITKISGESVDSEILQIEKPKDDN